MQALVVTIATDLIDGTMREYDITTDNRDSIRWDLRRGKEGWPKQTDAPVLFATFMAWSALTRTGQITGTDFEEFVAAVPYATARLDEVDPTRAATGAAS